MLHFLQLDMSSFRVNFPSNEKKKSSPTLFVAAEFLGRVKLLVIHYYLRRYIYIYIYILDSIYEYIPRSWSKNSTPLDTFFPFFNWSQVSPPRRSHRHVGRGSNSFRHGPILSVAAHCIEVSFNNDAETEGPAPFVGMWSSGQSWKYRSLMLLGGYLLGLIFWPERGIIEIEFGWKILDNFQRNNTHQPQKKVRASWQTLTFCVFSEDSLTNHYHDRHVCWSLLSRALPRPHFKCRPWLTSKHSKRWMKFPWSRTFSWDFWLLYVRILRYWCLF